MCRKVGLVELAVAWVVLIAIGALVLGLIGGWFAARRARTSGSTAQTLRATAVSAPSAAADTPETATETAQATTDTATTRPSVSVLAQGARAGADAEPEVSGLRLAGDAIGRAAEGPPGADMAATARLERDERARYAEIIGIETENASLRAVAARVPALERRIRELEAAIDDRTGQSEGVIDLTAPEPVVRPEGADVTRR